jgi:hypothetical protein
LVSETDQSRADNSGLEVKGSLQRINDRLILELYLRNATNMETISEFAIKFDKNSFGLVPTNAIEDFSLESGESKKIILDIDVNENNSNQAPGKPILINCALRTNLGVFVFQIPVMMSVLLVKQSKMVNVNEIRDLWKQIETESDMYHKVASLSEVLTSPQAIKERLLDNNIVFMEEGRNENGSPCLYFIAKTTNNLTILIQLTFKNGDVTLCVKSKNSSMIPLAHQ